MISRIATGTIAAACVLLLLPQCGQGQDRDVDLTGRYRCVGENADGSNYEGTVVITKNRDTYKLGWTIGSEQHFGVGLFDGQSLSVCWAADGGGGIVVYKLQRDGTTLAGKWAILGGDGQVLAETLTKR